MLNNITNENIQSSFKKYLFHYIILSISLGLAIFNAFKITPVADDYWYSALITEYGLLGSVQDFLANYNGLVFKEFFVNLFILPIAYLPIGIGGGITYTMTAILTTSAIIYLIKVIFPDFWASINQHVKNILFGLVLFSHYLSYVMWYELEPIINPINRLKDQAYDFNFWNAMMVYYFGGFALFLILFIFLQRIKTKNRFIIISSIIIFGICLGTYHYTLAALFIAIVMLSIVLNKYSLLSKFKIDIRQPILYIVSTVAGVALSFSFPSNFEKLGKLQDSNSKIPIPTFPTDIEIVDNFLRSFSVLMVNFINPSLLLVCTVIFLFIATLGLNSLKEHVARFFSIATAILVVSLLAFLIAFVIDEITLHEAWHYTYTMVGLRISFILISIGLGIKYSDFFKTSLHKLIAWLFIVFSSILLLNAHNYIIIDRSICWYQEDCKAGNAPDIERIWIHERWTQWKENRPDLPYRFSPVEGKY